MSASEARRFVASPAQHEADKVFFEITDRLAECVTVDEGRAVYAAAIRAIDAPDARRLHACRMAARDAWVSFLLTHRAASARHANANA